MNNDKPKEADHEEIDVAKNIVEDSVPEETNSKDLNTMVEIQADKVFKTLDKTSIGKFVPLQVKGLDKKDLALISLVLKAFILLISFLTISLVSEFEKSNNSIYKIARWVSVAILLLEYSFSGYLFSFPTKKLVSFYLLSLGIKSTVFPAFLLISVFVFAGTFPFVLTFLYLTICLYIDIGFLIYLRTICNDVIENAPEAEV